MFKATHTQKTIEITDGNGKALARYDHATGTVALAPGVDAAMLVKAFYAECIADMPNPSPPPADFPVRSNVNVKGDKPS